MFWTVLLVIFWISSFCVVYTYALYPLLLTLWTRLYPKEPPKTSGDYRPGVSIIIAAYNEESVIRARIENCLVVDYPADKLDIIIASDGSSDRTCAIAAEYKSKGVRLLDFQERRGKVNVLNDAVKQARHEILLFSDANTFFAVDAIKKIVRHFETPEVGCVCGGLEFVNAKGSKTGELEGFYWRYETQIKKMEGARGSLLGANGAIYALRKDLYVPCPPNTVVEDFVLPMRILQQGYQVIYDPYATASEETTQHVIQEKQRRIRIGAGDFQALTMLWPMLNPFRGFSAWAFWSHKVLRWFAPFFMITAFVSNMCLIRMSFFRLLFVCQCIFYGSALLGQYWSRKGIRANRFFSLCYYFVSMNLALLLGFFRFLKGTQKVTWVRTER